MSIRKDWCSKFFRLLHYTSSAGLRFESVEFRVPGLTVKRLEAPITQMVHTQAPEDLPRKAHGAKFHANPKP